MLKVGIVGVGFMGYIHYLAYQRVKGVKVAAIVSRDEKKLAGDWRDIKGNFGPPGQQMDLSGIKKFRTLDELLDDPSIDLVDICLPPYLHAETTVRALKAGKHVFCEKPMALTAAEANRMVAAADKAGKLLFIGHVLPYLPEYRFAMDVIRRGKYGKLLGGTFKRIISDPLWLPDFYDPKRVGGPVIDLHIHDAHFIRLTCGMPTAVTSQGRMRGEVVEFLNTQFEFADKSLSVAAVSGVINQQGRPFTHAFEIYLEKGTLLFDFAVIGKDAVTAMPLTVLAKNGDVERVELPASDPIDGFVGEIQEVAKCIKGNKPSAVLGGDLARDALVICQKESDSVVKGKRVMVG